MSVVDGLFIILSGAAVVADELDFASEDEVPDGGVLDVELDGVEGDAPGLVVVAPEDDDGGVVLVELDDVDELGGVDGLVVEDDEVDGDGVTTGGVVVEVFVSRWQPASPSAKPVQSSVITARLIVISRSG